MSDEKRESLDSLESNVSSNTPHRQPRRLNLKGELLLALAPTVTVLSVFAFVEVFSRQRLLFASLASSAFLIYLDPQHKTNSVRTLLISQLGASVIGYAAFAMFGGGYLSGGVAMIAAIVLMILIDAMHPPAVSTALSFAFRTSTNDTLLLFGLAVGATCVLVLMNRAALWSLKRLTSTKQT